MVRIGAVGLVAAVLWAAPGLGAGVGVEQGRKAVAALGAGSVVLVHGADGAGRVWKVTKATLASDDGVAFEVRVVGTLLQETRGPVAASASAAA